MLHSNICYFYLFIYLFKLKNFKYVRANKFLFFTDIICYFIKYIIYSGLAYLRKFFKNKKIIQLQFMQVSSCTGSNLPNNVFAYNIIKVSKYIDLKLLLHYLYFFTINKVFNIQVNNKVLKKKNILLCIVDCLNSLFVYFRSFVMYMSKQFFIPFNKLAYLLKILYLRKNKNFNKGRYSRNRQNYRTGVYWCLYINIIALLGLNFIFYGFCVKFSALWFFFFLFLSSFFFSKVFKYKFLQKYSCSVFYIFFF